MTCYEAVLETLRADRSMQHSVSLLQLETGYSARQIRRALERLDSAALLHHHTDGDSLVYSYRSRGSAHSGRVSGETYGRCVACNRFNEDGTVNRIHLGQVEVRACDHCLKEAGLTREKS